MAAKSLKTGPWTPSEIAVLLQPGSHREVAERLKRPYSAVEHKRRDLRNNKGVMARAADKAPVSALERQGIAHYKKRAEELELVNERNEALAKALLAAAPRSYRPHPSKLKLPKGDGQKVSFLLMCSDTHMGAVVCEDEAMGLGRYDMDVARDRLAFMRDKVMLIAMAQTNTIEELVVWFGGDNVDGALKHGAEAEQMYTLTEQVTHAAHAFAKMLRDLAAVFPRIRCYSSPGNHGRMPHQHKTPDKHQFSSFDTLVVELTKALVKDIRNIEVHIDKAVQQKFKVQDHQVLAMHGHTLRGADKALGLPNHAIGRQISAAAQIACKTGESMPKFIIHGHFHRVMMLPHSNGFVIGNGSPVGTDTYALTSNFSISDPAQVLLKIHHKHGLIGVDPLYLKDAKVGSGRGLEP